MSNRVIPRVGEDQSGAAAGQARNSFRDHGGVFAVNGAAVRAAALALLAVVCTFPHGAAGAGGKAPRPNFVLILTDDQGYADLGVHGNPVVRTPHLDSFAREAIVFSDFHVSPTCSPTRAALLTGRDANRTGVWHTAAGRGLMRRNEVTVAEMLRQAGYATGIFGKWHLGSQYPFRPGDR
ncbi:MAG: sulfatase-like hydrolase/transferase, partial [Rhodospirillaceae bacterium]|nr:sulfatase-like hydrolase/transferase [Rhodospirillaceae bacterium]